MRSRTPCDRSATVVGPPVDPPQRKQRSAATAGTLRPPVPGLPGGLAGLHAGGDHSAAISVGRRLRRRRRRCLPASPQETRLGLVGNRQPESGVEHHVGTTLGREPIEDVAGVGDVPSTGFERFFEQAWPGAVRLAALLTQDPGAAEELAQDAFTEMYKRWGRAENPEAYLRTTLVNRCHNWRRRSQVRDAKLPLVAGSTTVDFRSDDLADAVAALPYRQRAVIVLRYYGDLSEAEISAALGCRNGTVKSLAARALARLERVIER